MFDVGEYVVYGNSGVCRVDKIGKIELSGFPKDKVYYTLVPVYQKDSKVYTPVDNDRVVMRAVISKKDAENLINDIKNIGLLEGADGKRKEEIFKEAMKTGNCVEWIKVIKTIYLKKQTRLSQGKKATTCDEKYFKIAEDSLYGELAVALDMDKNSVRDFICRRIDQIKD
ncbi:MAG: CarD family transcriptional regulator [Eubacterium sp.]